MTHRIETAASGEGVKRPLRSHPDLVREAAERIAEICVKWTGEGQRSDWIDQIIRGQHTWNCGYQLARHLEQCCYIEPDAMLVDDLDGAGSFLDTAHTKAVKEWVTQTGGFDPAFQVGDVVRCRLGVGPIWRIDRETAQYCVATTDRDWGQGGGYIINAEDVSDAS